MAQGDFTRTVKKSSEDEIGQLQHASNETVSQLHSMIQDVDGVISKVSSSAVNMATLAEDTDHFYYKPLAGFWVLAGGVDRAMQYCNARSPTDT